MTPFTRLVRLAAVASALSASAFAATFDLQTATIADINAAIDAGALSSEKLVQLYTARLDAYDKTGPKINSVITRNPNALAEARALDAERKATGRRSALHGIPVMIKDLIDVAGLPTSAGFVPFGHPIPPRDAGLVDRLHKAGAIVLAKVATVNWFGKGFDETHPIGRSMNPYNETITPGMSSNGVGASMAAYFAAVGIGTDTNGSVQIPTSYCSLVGMVATQGMVTRTGIVPRGPTQDRAGPMGRSVYDIAATLSVIAGLDFEDLGTQDGIGHFPKSDWSKELAGTTLVGKRVGVLREMFNTGPYDPEVKEIFDRALADLVKGGAIVVDPVTVGLNLKVMTSNAVLGTTHPRAGSRSLPYEVTATTNEYFERLGPNRPWKTLQQMVATVGPDKFSDEYVHSPEFTEPDKMPDYLSRQELRTAVTKKIEDMIVRLNLDAVVLPYQMVPPMKWDTKADKYNSEDRTNTLTSTTGLPGIIMPGGYTKDNQPIGIQFAARNWGDLMLLKVAYGYEQVSRRRKTPESTPPLPGEKFDY